MNTKQIQFNHRWAAALLLAGLILALTAGLGWAGAEASDSTVQPANMVQQSEAYSLQPNQTGLSAAVDCPRTDFWRGESGLLPWSQLRSVKGRKPGASGG